jgi:shikimate-5-dehydrogenase
VNPAVKDSPEVVQKRKVPRKELFFQAKVSRMGLFINSDEGQETHALWYRYCLCNVTKGLYIIPRCHLWKTRLRNTRKMATGPAQGCVDGAMSADAMSTKHFHILGQGISFSMSPTIHIAAFRHYGLPHSYDIRETQTVEESGHLILDPLFGGASVTMPHKLAVHKFCDEQSIHARRIGAINTLVVDHDAGKRRIVGDNTDWSGLYALINLYTKSSKSKPTVGLVIGAGGASRAALYAMYQAGLQRVLISNRTIANAETIAKDFEGLFRIEIVADLKSLPEPPEVIIGTIPADKTTEKTFPELFSRNQGLCIDMAYKPRDTPLLSMAKRHEGWKTIPGVEVLLYQAFDQFRLWTGKASPQNVMERAVVDHDRKMEAAIRDPRL